MSHKISNCTTVPKTYKGQKYGKKIRNTRQVECKFCGGTVIDYKGNFCSHECAKEDALNQDISYADCGLW